MTGQVSLQENFWLSSYAISRHWKSDLTFFEDELQFLHLLIEKHLSILNSHETTNPVNRLISHVTELESQRQVLLKKIARHVQYIEIFVENPFVQNAQDYKDEHERLESAFADFVKTFRNVKAEVMTMIEAILRSKK